MLGWFKRRRLAERTRLGRIESAEPVRTSGTSAGLHKYLDERYADALVLTFAEIEDLAGFALPELARRSVDWWTAPDANAIPPRFSDSWLRANRTARPNLQAQTVAFERTGR